MSTILALLALATQSLLLQTAPLQIGDAAPTLTLGEFVAGEPLSQLTKGTVYVIEFSGTTCVPCIQLMPHLSALQERFPEVVMISVFPEEATEGKRVLKKAEPESFVWSRGRCRIANVESLVGCCVSDQHSSRIYR